MGVRLLPPEVLLPVVPEFPVASWLLQRLLSAHKAGQVRLDLEDVLRPLLRLPLQLLLLERHLEPVCFYCQQRPEFGVTDVVAVLVAIALALALLLLHHLAALGLNGSPLVNP